MRNPIRMQSLVIGIGLVLVFAFALGARAQSVPSMISYQGRLTANGTNFNGTGYFKFALMGTQVPFAPPPATYWSNDGMSIDGSEPTWPTAIPVSNGLFNVMLGDNILPNMFAIDPSTFGGSYQVRADAQLRIWFCETQDGTFEQLTPDQPLGSVGYAMMAAKVGYAAIGPTELAHGAVIRNAIEDNAVNASKLADGAVTSNKLAAGSVTTDKIAAAVITGYHIQNGSVNLSRLAQDGALSGQVIRWSGTAWVASNESGGVADGSITSAKILDGTIVNDDISASAAIADTKLATIATAGKVANAALSASVSLLGQTIESAEIADGAILNADISTGAAITDTKLATIATAGKVANSATTATAANTGNAIVARDGSGNFSAGTITASAFSGGGAGLTSLRADQLSSGTVPNTRLGTDVALRSGGNTFTDNQNFTGNVGLGVASPAQRLHVAGNARVEGLGAATPAIYAANSSSSGIGIFSTITSSDASLVVVNKGAGNLIKGFSGATGGNLVFQVDNAGAVYCAENLSCLTLTIRGGADLAEPFAMSDVSIVPGAVVVIDSAQPGRLKLSTQAYDSKVAGIVSGAGGVQPGISMIQTDVLEGGRNVALSGRVYALVDAGHAPVEPGDLLTTSATPGHAMKATDVARRSGAILGKAMTPLSEGRGLVLVLVSLQ